MQLGAAIGTMREHEQLVCTAVAEQKIELSIVVNVSEGDRGCFCATPGEVWCRRKKAAVALLQQQLVSAAGVPHEHVEPPVAVHIAQREGRRGGAQLLRREVGAVGIFFKGTLREHA